MTNQQPHRAATERGLNHSGPAVHFGHFAALGRARLEAAFPTVDNKGAPESGRSEGAKLAMDGPQPLAAAVEGNTTTLPSASALNPAQPLGSGTRLSAAVDRAVALATLSDGPLSLFVKLADETGVMARDLVLAEWPQFAVSQGVSTWTYGGANGVAHNVVELSEEACATLADLKAISAPGNSRVFHWLRNTLHATDLFACFVRKHRLGPLRLCDIRKARRPSHPRP